MAEVKNTFIKSKMNKDLDARLLPNGEYREGVNIQVSKSEGADVGALENVLGNEKLIDFSSTENTGIPNLHTIGMYTNNLDDNIYIFLTDYNELEAATYNSQSLNYSSNSNNFIYQYNTSTGVANKLVSGSFLNFSKNFSIYSVNILEDILFWTDNRNQPRKINVTNALTDNYYTSEDQISVATYAPFQPIEVYFKSELPYLTNGGSGVTDGITSAASTTIVLTSSGFAGINPSINNNTALVGAKLSTSTGAGLAADTTLVSYTPTTITVAAGKVTGDIPSGTTIYFNENPDFNQYKTSMIDANTPMNPGETYSSTSPGATTNKNYNPNFNGDPDFLEDKFVRFSYRFKYEDGENSVMAPFTQPCFIPKQDGYFLTGDEEKTYRSTVVNFMENKVNDIFLQIPLPLKRIPTSRGSGTNSLLIYDHFAANEIGNELKISEIEILYKESDKQAVQVVDTIPRSGNNGYEVLGRNADGTFDTVLSYNYQGTKPYKTLPESEIIRVFDKVPVRALGQEIIGNRVVYSNFQDKHTPVQFIDYNVGVSTKFLEFKVNDDPDGNPLLPPLEKTSIVEYPMHTIKQNRNYQVGIILSDQFGRSSTTILSSASKQGTDADDSSLKLVGDTIYFPYNDVNVDLSLNPSTNNINAWPGDSIKILFNQVIDNTTKANPTNGWPGLYNGDPTSSEYNPLGWYSYKIVVKQNEQEYYNVYLPGILNGYPSLISPAPDPINSISTITLINDNINKVPRDLTEVGPEQRQFRSAIRLYGRITPNASGNPTYNIQFNPGIISDPISTIGDQDGLLQAQANPAAGTNFENYKEIYQTESSPLLARITQENISNPIGSLAMTGATYNIILGIYETTPFESNIDIYWETSSTGTVLELNEAIESGSTGIKGFTTDTNMVIAPDKWNFNLYEDITPGGSPTSTYNQATGTYTTLNFFPYIEDTAGEKLPVVNSNINTDITGFWVTNGENPAQDITDKFELIKVNGSGTATQPDSYYVKIANNTFFSYQENSPVVDSFNFNFRIENLDGAPAGPESQYGTFTTITLVEKLENLIPIIDCPTSPLIINSGQTGVIYTFTGNNGSAGVSFNQENLTWALISQTPTVDTPGAVELTINPTTGELSEETGNLTGAYQLQISLTDAGTNNTTLGGTPTAICNVSLNGSVGYDTNSINTDFNQVKNMVINQSSESSGFYWGTGNDPITSTPFPDQFGPTAREPIAGLTNNTVNGGATQVNASPSIAYGDWKFYNSNRNGSVLYGAPFSGLQGEMAIIEETTYNDQAVTSLSQAGITSGSAYIKVDYYQGQYNIQNDYPSIIWPTYLQYRETPQASWVTARDVEGKEIKFGGNQVNNYVVAPVSQQDGIFTESEGVLNKRTTSNTAGFTGVNGFNQNYSFQTSLRGPSNQSVPSIECMGSKIFVVGRNQAYRDLSGEVSTDPNSVNPPDYFGEYRLIVRYPAGDNISINNQEKVIPVLTTSSIPTEGTSYGDPALARQNQRVILSSGDFFTPTQLLTKYNNNVAQNPLPGSLPTVPSFSYQISILGSTSRELAESTTPSEVVYAKEWAFRYVSQFYTDPTLETPWRTPVGGENQWYAYRGAQDSINTGQGWNNINIKCGNEHSNTRQDGSPVYQSDTAYENIYTGPGSSNSSTVGLNHNDWNRKWTAQFDQYGKKIIRTAEPCVANLPIEATDTEQNQDTGQPTTPVCNDLHQYAPNGYQGYSVSRISNTEIQAVFSPRPYTPGAHINYATSFAKAWLTNSQQSQFAQNTKFTTQGIVSSNIYMHYNVADVAAGAEACDTAININASQTQSRIELFGDGNGPYTVKITNLVSVSNFGSAAIQNWKWSGL